MALLSGNVHTYLIPSSCFSPQDKIALVTDSSPLSHPCPGNIPVLLRAVYTTFEQPYYTKILILLGYEFWSGDTVDTM